MDAQKVDITDNVDAKNSENRENAGMNYVSYIVTHS